MAIMLEEREEEKYPKWFRYFGMIYGAVLLWTNFSLPATGYDLESIMLVLFLWLPVPIGLLYIFEKPAIVGEHKHAVRILFTVFAAIAIFWGLLLSYAFIE